MKGFDDLLDMYFEDMVPQPRPFAGATQMPVPYAPWETPPPPERQPFDWGQFGLDVLSFSPLGYAMDNMPSLGEMGEQATWAAKALSGFPTPERTELFERGLYELTDTSFEPYLSHEERMALPPDDPRSMYSGEASSIAPGVTDIFAVPAAKLTAKYAPRVADEGLRMMTMGEMGLDDVLAAAPEGINAVNRQLGLPEMPFKKDIIVGERNEYMRTIGPDSPDTQDLKLAKELWQDYSQKHGLKFMEFGEGSSTEIVQKLKGEKARTARRHIFDATGWWLGRDGLWRREIDDPIEIISGQSGPLHTIAETGELTDWHPDLADIPITQHWRSADTFFEEPLYGGPGQIQLGRARKDTGETLLRHELQHAVQWQEGFAGGADLADNTRKSHRLYNTSAGEVEARNVERRAGMTEDERRMLPPWMTEDVAERDQWFDMPYDPGPYNRPPVYSLDPEVSARATLRDELQKENERMWAGTDPFDMDKITSNDMRIEALEREMDLLGGGSVGPKSRSVENPSVFVAGRELPMVMKKRAKNADEVVVDLDMNKMDNAWAEDRGFYLDREGGNRIGRRYENILESIEDLEDLDMPEVGFTDSGILSFTDGRHRAAVLRDLGAENLPVSMSKADAQKAQELGLLARAPRQLAAGGGGRSPVGMIDLADDAPISPLRPAEEDLYRSIREDVTASIKPESGSPLGGRRGQASAPWRATAGAVDSDQLDPNVRAVAARTFQLGDKYSAELEGLGQTVPQWIELNKQPAASKLFRDRLQAAKDALGDQGASVDVYDSYKGMRLFMDPDGNAGFAVKPDGDVISVFNNSPQKGIVPQMVLLATQEGGRKLDAFDTILPHFYNRAGYEDTASLAWDPTEAPMGWDEATMGTPHVAAMTYSPEGRIRGYSHRDASMAGDYPSLMESQDPMIYAPEMSPGVTRQLHHAVPRADTGGRTTVRDPQRKAYPDIYAPRREIIERGAEQIAPETPAMEQLFGVTRRDLDDLTWLKQEKHENIDIPVYQTTDRGGQHTLNVMTPANEMRLMDTLALAAADPRFAGSYGWYLSDPLLQRFIAELGPQLGNERYMQFMQIGSALSSGSAVPQEIKRASEAFRQLVNTGDLRNFTQGQLPEGYGHIYHGTAHRSQLETLQDTGQIYTPESLMDSPKTPNYLHSKTGENLLYPTQDAHFVRGTGLADVRPSADTGSISKLEAKKMREWYAGRVAEPLGMRGSPAQALLWNVLAPATGVKTQVGKPFLELFSDAVVREAQRTGKKPNDVLVDFMHGRGRLSAAFGAAVGAGLLSEVEEQPQGDI